MATKRNWTTVLSVIVANVLLWLAYEAGQCIGYRRHEVGDDRPWLYPAFQQAAEWRAARSK